MKAPNSAPGASATTASRRIFELGGPEHRHFIDLAGTLLSRVTGEVRR